MQPRYNISNKRGNYQHLQDCGKIDAYHYSMTEDRRNVLLELQRKSILCVRFEEYVEEVEICQDYKERYKRTGNQAIS